MGPFDASTVTKHFKRTFAEATLNEMGKAARLCQRERAVTPWRLMLALIEAFSSATELRPVKWCNSVSALSFS